MPQGRMQYLALKDGVFWVNDSAATTPNATWYSLSTIARPVHWICTPHALLDHELRTGVASRAKSIVVVGHSESMDLLLSHMLPPTTVCATIAEAVVRCAYHAEPGHLVLFSPGAPGASPGHEEARTHEFNRCVARM